MKRNMIKILVHIIVVLGRQNASLSTSFLQQKNKRVLQGHMCLVLIILKQWHTEVATKIYFNEQEKEYNRIIL